MSIARELLKKELKMAKGNLAWLTSDIKERKDKIATTEGAAAAIREHIAKIERELKEASK